MLGTPQTNEYHYANVNSPSPSMSPSITSSSKRARRHKKAKYDTNTSTTSSAPPISDTFNCCNIVFPTLNELIQHFDEIHSGTLDDSQTPSLSDKVGKGSETIEGPIYISPETESLIFHHPTIGLFAANYSTPPPPSSTSRVVEPVKTHHIVNPAFPPAPIVNYGSQYSSTSVASPYSPSISMSNNTKIDRNERLERKNKSPSNNNSNNSVNTAHNRRTSKSPEINTSNLSSTLTTSGNQMNTNLVTSTNQTTTTMNTTTDINTTTMLSPKNLLASSNDIPTDSSRSLFPSIPSSPPRSLMTPTTRAAQQYTCPVENCGKTYRYRRNLSAHIKGGCPQDMERRYCPYGCAGRIIFVNKNTFETHKLTCSKRPGATPQEIQYSNHDDPNRSDSGSGSGTDHENESDNDDGNINDDDDGIDDDGDMIFENENVKRMKSSSSFTSSRDATPISSIESHHSFSMESKLPQPLQDDMENGNEEIALGPNKYDNNDDEENKMGNEIDVEGDGEGKSSNTVLQDVKDIEKEKD